jgi:restriction system protein
MEEQNRHEPSDIPIPQVNDDWIASLIKHWRWRAAAFTATVTAGSSVSGDLSVVHAPQAPELLLQAGIINFGDKTQEGQLITGVSIYWYEILKWLADDPEFLYKIHWRKLEELIAGAYDRAGYSEVILTPRSGDRGRDIIATKPGIGSIRFFDQVKAYKRGRIVTAEEVRAMFGVIQLHQNISKGVITTSSRFAPGVFDEFKGVIPYRLELKDGPQLLSWLQELLSGQ